MIGASEWQSDRTMLKTPLSWVSRTPAPQPASEGDSARIASHEIAHGRADVTIYGLALDTAQGRVNCWTYVSHGLSRVGQKEVVLSVRREDTESLDGYPRSVLELFESFHSLAGDGRVVDVGSFTALAPDSPGFLGDAALRGIAYTPAEKVVDFELPPSSITALLLTQNELDAAMQFGLVRLMSILGFRYRYFPTAAWLVRGRPDVTSPAEMSASVLGGTRRARVADARAYLRGIETHRESRPPTGSLENSATRYARQEVVLELPAASAAQFGQLLGQSGQGEAIALITSPNPQADACFVWMPGRPEPNAITAPGGSGLRIAGNHVLFVPEQGHDDVRIFEDGFALLMTNTTWHELRQLFGHAAQNWGMPVTGDMGFRLKVIA
jgi:hypothetical protein